MVTGNLKAAIRSRPGKHGIQDERSGRAVAAYAEMLIIADLEAKGLLPKA